MKFLKYLLPFLAFNAMATQVQVTLNTEGFNALKLKNTTVKFESTNPACSRLIVGPLGLPLIVKKIENTSSSIRAINDKAVLVEFNTEYTGNDFCLYRFVSASVVFDNSNWLSLTSTEGNESAQNASQLDLFKNEGARFEASCLKTRCKRSVNGRNIDSSTNNLVEFYLNGKTLKEASSLQSEISISFK